MTRVKICGIKSLDEARISCISGAWAIGEVFAPSRRKIEVDTAAAINKKLGKAVIKAGVFVNEQLDTIKAVIETCELDMVQLHGDEPPEFLEELPVPVIKCFSVQGLVDPDHVRRWRPWAYLFDTGGNGHRGGTGICFDWKWLEPVGDWPNIILAGGLNTDNVGAAIKQVRPYAVDVASGVEYLKGGKDPGKIEQFIRRVREADNYVT